VNAVAVALKDVAPGEPLTSAGLTMVPLLGGRGEGAGYLTLDDAIATGSFRVTEVSEAGSVPELLVVNDLGEPVLIVDGEELVGAKQNRIVNLTILVPGRSRIPLPVSCVESGRWRHRTRHFGTAPRVHYASGRAMKARAVTESYRTVGRPASDQGAIWDDIARKSARFAAHSETAAMDVLFETSEPQLRQLEAHFEPVAGQVGAVFLIAGAPIGLDVFDSPATWQKLAPKLVASYGLDAVDQGRSVAAGVTREPRFLAQAVEELLARASALQIERYPSAGLGEDVRLSGPSLAGGALVVDERLVHLAVFPR
jgi:hypothetical protein